MSEIKVVIKWEVLKELEDVIKSRNESEDSGVYMITGHHPVFGNDSLLYIGMTKDSTFGGRFSQPDHKKYIKQEWGVKIYIGRIDSINNDEDYSQELWESIIEDVEALLIYFHSPPHNSRSVDSFPDPNNDLRIINIENYGALYPEISHEALRLDE
jgi:hypothetical protein